MSHNLLTRFMLFIACLITNTNAFAQKPLIDANFLSSISRWDKMIIDSAASKAITPGELYDSLANVENVVLGEWHYNSALQQEQANTIIGIINAGKLSGKFTIGWEFLNISEQAYINNMYDYYLKNRITVEQLALYLQNGNADAITYAPILKTAKDYGGQLLATNLSRQQKAPVTSGGISKIDPMFLPPNYQSGGKDYLERFIAEMGGHSSPTLLNYFDSQCLTDDVIAYTLLEKASYNHKFLVIGAFHSDYNDGVVVRLKSRSPTEKTSTVRFIDGSLVTRSQLTTMISNSRYGSIADYIVVINEPKP